jgi:hypothetical protein
MKAGFTFRIFTVFLYVVVATESSTYRAAVYEHAVVLPSETVKILKVNPAFIVSLQSDEKCKIWNLEFH